jgi:ubiquinone biosynthesis UbiH/UbiF/VisC/COQ6 family hydroxylase
VRAARGLSVALVAQQRPAAPQGLDARVYALSPGNIAFLQSLGVRMAQDRLTPVHAMRIFGDDGGSLAFDAYDAGVPALAWIVEDAVLQDALWQGLEPPALTAHCERLSIEDDRVVLAMRDANPISARLVVGADGARSFVREQAGIRARDTDYGQSALVANFRCKRPHGNVAFQWFQRGAVLALLPLPQNQVSMVWSLPTGDIDRLQKNLCQEAEAASGDVLGELTLVTPPRSYALRRLAAERLVAPRVALAGDAGHVIHPLAGQGLNLGLQDARTLAEVLNSREAFRDPGELRLLRRYERSRAEPILAMDTMVDTLFGLFGAESPLAARLRNAGLNLTDRLPVVKNMLMRQAMT